MLFNREIDYAVRVLKNLSTERSTSISSFVTDEFISEAIALIKCRGSSIRLVLYTE